MKTVTIDDIGDVVITKRRGQKSIRISVSGGQVRVSQPSWLPYSAGETFARSKAEWIKHNYKPVQHYENTQQISVTRTLLVRQGYRRSSKLVPGELIVTLEASEDMYTADAQAFIHRKVIKALRDEAEDYLPKRVARLADMYGFSYRSISIKQLKRRWGSCNAKKELVFNLRLVSLDQSHIDYVILHELCHTVHMHHGKEFWDLMESVYPGARRIARTVRRINSSSS